MQIRTRRSRNWRKPLLDRCLATARRTNHPQARTLTPAIGQPVDDVLPVHDQAEERVKMLAVSQPAAFHGYEGLAVEKATRLHQKGYIDQVVLGLVQKTRRSIAES